MADDEIKITIKADDQSGAVLRAAGKNVEDMAGKSTKATEASRLGFWTMGEAAENAAQSMGVPNQMSRQLGNSVEGLASKLGTGVMAFGLVGLAAGAAYAVFQRYNEQQRKLQEETLKAADASMKWVDAAKIETKETDVLRESKDRLFQLEKEKNIWDLEKGLAAQSDVVNALFEKFSKETQRASLKTGGFQGSLLTRIIYGTQEERAAVAKEVGNEAAIQMEKYIQMQEQLEIARGEGTLRRGGAKGSEGSKKEFFYDELSAESEYLRAVDALWSEQDKNYQGHLDMQLAAFDVDTASKMQRLWEANNNFNQVKDQFAIRDIERARMVAAEEFRITQQKIAQEMALERQKEQAKRVAMGLAENLLADFAAMAVSHGKKGAEEQKKAARMQATVHTIAGVAKALSDYSYPYSLIIGGLVLASGMAQVSKINSASYESGGGSGGLSFAGSAANTGLATDQPAAAPAGPSITVNYYGTVIDTGSAQKAARDFLPYLDQARADGVR